MAERPLPSEQIADRQPIKAEQPAFAVDLRRCIGCHACSVACKTVHEVPLGEFRLRVRWLPSPEPDTTSSRAISPRPAPPNAATESTYAFVPVFSESLCHDDFDSTQAGLDPACVRACPTDALLFGDLRDANSPVTRLIQEKDARHLVAPDAHDLKQDVVYVGLEDWVSGQIHSGAALDPRDEDPIYEQR